MNKEQDIVEGNKAIAIFMGAEFAHGFWAGSGDYYFPNDKATANELKYHSSWDWLMPVVFKIRDYEKSVKKASGVLFAIAVDYKTMTIESVWQAVVKFIQWHQQNQKPQ